MKKVLLLCHYSNEQLRNQIDQTPIKRANQIRRLLGKPDVFNQDAAPWIPTFIDGIKKFGDDIELHIVNSCVCMKYPRQDYCIDNVHYHIFNYDLPFFHKLADIIFHSSIKSDYKIYRKIISKIIADISPDLILLSGAENPEYGWPVIDHLDIPTFVILQTLLSSQQRMKLNVGNPYRRKFEQLIFTKCNYFTSSEDGSEEIIKSFNPNAVCFDFEFSTLPPPVFDGIEKEFDFVFVAGALTKFKGIEDTIKAFGILCKQYPNLTLDIIGLCNPMYRCYLNDLTKEFGIIDNIRFEGRIPKINDMFKQVQKARIMVVPGITAPLNTTVREGMFMGMPVIQYETSATRKINKDKLCILAAKMEDIDDLANKMLYLYNNLEYAMIMAKNGQEYANSHFTSYAVGKMLVDQIHEVFKLIEIQ